MARKYAKSALNSAKAVKRGRKSARLSRDLSHSGLSRRLEVVLDFLGDLMDGETRDRLARRAKELSFRV